jgi:hypothetical protein
VVYGKRLDHLMHGSRGAKTRSNEDQRQACMNVMTKHRRELFQFVLLRAT